MAYTPTRHIFRFFKRVIKTALIHDPSTITGYPDPEVMRDNWPTLGVDFVRRVEGDAVQAVRTAVESLADGHYQTGILIAMSTITPGEEDTAGHEFGNFTPVTILILTRLDGRSQPDASIPDPFTTGVAETDDERVAEWLDDISDEVYLILWPLLNDPNAATIPAGERFLNYTFVNQFALQGAAEWKGRRLTYVCWRQVEKREPD